MAKSESFFLNYMASKINYHFKKKNRIQREKKYIHTKGLL